MKTNKSVFISYAWDKKTRVSKYANEINTYLENHHIEVYYDKKKNGTIGSDINEFISKINTVDHVIVLLTDDYIAKIDDDNSRVYEEWQLIKERMQTSDVILPILYGIDASKKPYELNDIVHYYISDAYLDRIGEVIVGNLPELGQAQLLDVNDALKTYQLNILTQEIINELYPEYDWVRIKSDEFYKIYDHNIVQIIDVQDTSTNHILELETICLEGYIEKSLKGVFVFTNFNLNERFMCMAHMHYQKSGKNIHFFDRQLLVNYNNKYRISIPNIPKHSSFKSLRILKDYILSEESLNNYKSSFINQSELALENINSDFSYISKLALNETYHVQLKIVSDHSQSIQIKLKDTPSIKCIHENNIFNVIKGLNYISFPIVTLQEAVQLQPEIEILYDTNTLIHKMNYITIHKIIKKSIVFNNQLETEKSFKNFIYENIHNDSNLFLNLYADGGSGKTHILQSLTKDIHFNLSDHIEILNISFTNSHKKNRDLLSNLLFYIVTFMPFEYGCDFLVTSKKIKNYMDADLINVLKKLKYEDVFSQFTSELISALEKDHSQNLPYFVNDKKHMVILDDLQKLDSDASLILVHIINYIRKTQKKFMVLTSSRKKELSPPLVHLLKFSESRELMPLTHRDIMSSIQSRRPEWKSYIFHSAIDSSLDGFLVFYAIEFLNKLCSIKIDSLMQFNERIKMVSNTISTPNYVQNKFLDLSYEEANLLNIVYILSNLGLNFEWTTSNELEILNDLKLKGLLKKVNDRFEKAHDLLVESFPFEYDGSVASVLLERYQLSGSTELLCEIIKCRFDDRLKYVNEGIEILKSNFENAYYNSSLLLSESIEYAMSEADFSTQFTDILKLEIKFIRAYCLNFCGSVVESKNCFFAISTMRKIDDLEYMGIVLESATEKLSLDYWHIDNNNLIEDILEVRYRIESYDISSNINMIRAYLNTFNREMVARLLYDDYQEAKLLLIKNEEKAKEYLYEDYTGFAHMDFAKGFYNVDTRLSLNHLMIAEKIFMNGKNSRRLLDCQCEIEFLNLVLDEQRSLKELEKISKTLFERNLIQLYVKSLIKIMCIKVYRNENALRLLDDTLGKITLLSPDSIDNRLTLIIANLDYIKSIKLEIPLYISDVEERLKRYTFGDSYREIIDMNKRMNKDAQISWASDNKSDSFLLDLRVW